MAIEIKNTLGVTIFNDESANLSVGGPPGRRTSSRRTSGRRTSSAANLQSANLQSANLQSANLRSADLRSADLQSANLRSANLRSADLRSANLRSANLQSADLRLADLRSANLQSADLPSPTIMLLAYWGCVSDELCADLMMYDASCHPSKKAFDVWAAGGSCPYSHVNIQRACNFTEKKELWGRGKFHTPYSLMLRLFEEKEIKR